MQLESFFSAMGRFLGGDIGPSAVEERLGACPSGTERLGLYAELVRRQRRDVLDSLFPAVRAACGRLGPTTWPEIVTAYTRAHPPRHWEPNHSGAHLGDFLASCRSQDPTVPEYLEEVADYELIGFLAGICDAKPKEGPALERGMFVRRYEHDVVTFVERVRAGGASSDLPLPARTPVAIVVGWSATLERVLTLPATAAMLGAIACRALRPVPFDAEPSLLADAEHHLVNIGLLPPEATP
jgi:hypothetical protein